MDVDHPRSRSQTPNDHAPLPVPLPQSSPPRAPSPRLRNTPPRAPYVEDDEEEEEEEEEEEQGDLEPNPDPQQEPEYGRFEDTGAPRKATLKRAQEYVAFVESATLESCGMDKESCARLQNPPRSNPDLSQDPTLRLALRQFIANGHSDQASALGFQSGCESCLCASSCVLMAKHGPDAMDVEVRRLRVCWIENLTGRVPRRSNSLSWRSVCFLVHIRRCGELEK